MKIIAISMKFVGIPKITTLKAHIFKPNRKPSKSFFLSNKKI